MLSNQRKELIYIILYIMRIEENFVTCIGGKIPLYILSKSAVGNYIRQEIILFTYIKLI
jgi:hypothetical protein